MKNIKLFTLLLSVLISTACYTEVGHEIAQGVAGSASVDGGIVGVDKEALTHTDVLNSWAGISTESQVKQGLHCFTYAYLPFGNHTSQPNCFDVTASVPTARCIITASGINNGKETRIAMTSGSPATGTMTIAGVPGGTGTSTGIDMRYNVSSSFPKTYVYATAGKQYICTVACVPPQCAGVQATWTYSVEK